MGVFTIANERVLGGINLTNRQIAAVIDSRECHWGTSWSKYLRDGIRLLFSDDKA
ncbi:MAG TPA: hypothetical protein PLL98_08910 [Bacillota bacterium]|nr:hypothetical protein [Bacillota bacterium]HOR86593.1 hypothetical protein [Bacillota bacterium]HPL52621.1 hypothetical protein [Bacillota bacterium]